MWVDEINLKVEEAVLCPVMPWCHRSPTTTSCLILSLEKGETIVCTEKNSLLVAEVTHLFSILHGVSRTINLVIMAKLEHHRKKILLVARKGSLNSKREYAALLWRNRGSFSPLAKQTVITMKVNWKKKLTINWSHVFLLGLLFPKRKCATNLFRIYGTFPTSYFM